MLDVSVIYVEDEEVTREAVAAILRRRVRALFEARNGAEGLELFLERRPELVVTDIRMPVLGGLDMARTIKAEAPETQIVVTTAHGDTGYLIDAIDVGVDQYVLKPVDQGRLIAAVEKCARVIGLARDSRRHQQERERLIGELRDALSRVRQLSGLLPICASCKKIRDDRGYWNQIEIYIREHSEAEFTHGMCPECAEKAYEEIARLRSRRDSGASGG